MHTTVYFVRHAEPDYDNHDDLSRELTPKGQADTQRVTHFLLDKEIHHVYSSPYKRAYDTVAPFAHHQGLLITCLDGFKERKIDDVWIEDFECFTRNQWQDFSYQLANGESLQQVQNRNLQALQSILKIHPGKNLVVGSHGTALSTLVNYFQPTFTYAGFQSIKKLMPFVAKFIFDPAGNCLSIHFYNLFEEGAKHEISIL